MKGPKESSMSSQTQDFVHVATPEMHARFGPKFVTALPGKAAKQVVASIFLRVIRAGIRWW
jgi:hypothetical protein